MRVLAVLIVIAGVLATTAAAKPNASNTARTKAIICKVFGPYCRQAINVSSCETGGTFSIWAQNGQYLGLFQMGYWERNKYGHGNNAWKQARAAYRYFIDSGRDWSPWSCRWAA